MRGLECPGSRSPPRDQLQCRRDAVQVSLNPAHVFLVAGDVLLPHAGRIVSTHEVDPDHNEEEHGPPVRDDCLHPVLGRHARFLLWLSCRYTHSRQRPRYPRTSWTAADTDWHPRNGNSDLTRTPWARARTHRRWRDTSGGTSSKREPQESECHVERGSHKTSTEQYA